MKTELAILTGTAALLLAACFPSVNPYYTARDVAFDPALLGDWVEDDEHWLFERHPAMENAYMLTVTESEDRGMLTAVLFTLDGHRYLDVVAHEIDFSDRQSELVNASVFPGHLVFHVREIEPVLRLTTFDPDWLEQFIETNSRELSHIMQRDRLLLTGPTRELQRFLRRHVESGDLFMDDYSEMTRSGTGDR